VLVFVGLFALIQIIALVVMDQRRARIALAHIGQELDACERMFERLLTHDREQLERAAIVLAADSGFRAAITGNNINTITAVLRNHDTKGHRRAGEAFSFPHLLRSAAAAGKATSTVVMADGLAYQLVVVPVVATKVVAWVAMGFLLNDKRAHDLREVINLEVSFARQRATGGW